MFKKVKQVRNVPNFKFEQKKKKRPNEVSNHGTVTFVSMLKCNAFTESTITAGYYLAL